MSLIEALAADLRQNRLEPLFAFSYDHAYSRTTCRLKKNECARQLQVRALTAPFRKRRAPGACQ